MKQTLKMLAPYFAVGIFWHAFSNAWLAILAYHIQILLWSHHEFANMHRPGSKRIMLLALPAVAAGPLLYFLLPYITHADLSEWLANHHLSGLSFMVMIPYFGIVHPLLEQLHWGQLRENTPVAHFMFAGYHMLVLHSLLTIPWLMLCVAVLAAASFAWQQMTRRCYGLTVPVVSHVLADLGVIIAAWMRT